MTTATSTLRKLARLLRRPHLWLALAGGAWVWAGIDLTREPEAQVLARGYIGLVHLYQGGKARSGAHAICRFRPSCSRYSVQAVEQHGLARGLMLTRARLSRCRTNVPMGTADPVPQRSGSR